MKLSSRDGHAAQCGLGMKPPRFLTEGDVVEASIEELGRQRQYVRIYAGCARSSISPPMIRPSSSRSGQSAGKIRPEPSPLTIVQPEQARSHARIPSSRITSDKENHGSLIRYGP